MVIHQDKQPLVRDDMFCFRHLSVHLAHKNRQTSRVFFLGTFAIFDLRAAMVD